MEPPPNTSLTGTTEVIFNKHEFPGKTAKFVTVNKITAIINTLSNLIATKKMKKLFYFPLSSCSVQYAMRRKNKQNIREKYRLGMLSAREIAK